MRCFFCDTIPEIGGEVPLDKREKKHLFKTLRATAGESVEILDGKGKLATAVIHEEQCIVIQTIKEFSSPEQKIHLFVAPPKKNKMDHMLKQITELGVWSIQPIISERSVSVPNKDSVNERWDTIVIEACKQAKNPFKPVIHEALSFKKAVKKAKEMGYLSFYGSPTSTSGVNSAQEIAWFVGPEGGFTDSEEELMQQNGFNPIKIGNYVLRVETAAVAGLALLQ
jgi:16S rRNA (uracil1498-N3)-methyltransferase